jgi:hypothetical protein
MSTLVDISWSRLGSDIIGDFPRDNLGTSISFSADGTIVAIGATGNYNTYGYVKIYKNINNNWIQLGEKIISEAVGDYSAYVSLSADGTIVAIGGEGNDGNSPWSGHVRVYKYDASKNTSVTDQSSPNFGPVGWTRLGQDIDGDAEDDESGRSVSLSADGTIVAIGASGNNSGYVRIYKYDASKNTAVTGQSNPNFGPVGWTRLGQDINGEGSNDGSGTSVSLSADGTIVAIGATRNNANGSNSGHVRIYKYDPNKLIAVTDQSEPNFGPVGWTRLGRDIDGEAQYDRLGSSVSLNADGTIVAIGATGSFWDNNLYGKVYIYKYDASKNIAVTDQNSLNFGPVGWNRLGQKINSNIPGDSFGWPVSLSADGTVVAIGATSYDQNIENVNDNQGRICVYYYLDNSWVQLGNDFVGFESGEQFGSSTTLSADGTILGLGARYNNTNGEYSGIVRIYKLNGLEPESPISNICFPAGTPIQTDQGIIHIDKINPSVNTIRGNKIETITKTVTEDKYLICLEKDSLAKNIPNKKTLISKNHKLFYNGNMVPAKALLKQNKEGIYKVKYNGEVLYNVLLENKHDKMIVNNLICETLDPTNNIAEMHYEIKNGNLNAEQKEQYVRLYNEYVKSNKIFSK